MTNMPSRKQKTVHTYVFASSARYFFSDFNQIWISTELHISPLY